jgi:microcystin degradation protein MlrC
LRIARAEVRQESNIFSTLPADTSDFEGSTLLVGKEMPEGETGDAPLSGARSALADKTGVEMIPLIQAIAVPGGTGCAMPGSIRRTAPSNIICTVPQTMVNVSCFAR